MAKPFQGKQSPAEERAEARMVRSGKMSPAEYAAAEKREGDSKSKASLEARGRDLASGRMSESRYAGMASGEPKKMADGGLVSGMGFHAPNTPTGVCGPGVRSQQDYRK
jgi:hypothetical protein